VERIINLGDYWDAGALRKKAADIRSLTRANAEEHRRATQFLSAVRAIDNDGLRTAALCLDTGKIENFAKRLARRELRAGEGKSCPGKEKRRFFSAVSPEGISLFYESVRFLCGRIIAVRDEYSPAASLLLKYVKEQALGMGYDVVSCYCPLRPEEKLEHLFVPELELGFFTENSYHSMPEKADKAIRAKRFYDKGRMAENKLRLGFNKRAKKDLIQEAVSRLEAAKAIHDELEACYAAAMDFDRVQDLAQGIAEKILE